MIDFDAAVAHFDASDPKMARLTRQALTHDSNAVTVPKGRAKQQYFEALARAIVGQQLSTKAADTIWVRFESLCGKVTAQNALKMKHQQLRKVGLSKAKATYLHSLADSFVNKSIDLNKLDELDDEAVIAKLIELKGIGRWSAEMFLMFTLGRPDVFSSGDLGLIRAIEQHYKQENLKPDDAVSIAENWSPHRTTASLVLWHSRDNS